MRLADCETSHRHVRGHNVIVICGTRAIDDAERSALLAEYVASYGAGNAPAYFSPDGWQALAPVRAAPMPEATAASEEAKPAGDAQHAGDEPATTTRRRAR